MRVISGKYKGRLIKGYDIDGTRPTMHRVKESLLAMIQNRLLNSKILDLFSGSGNYAIEALSNGASYAYLNDLNKECIKVIKDNLNTIGITNYELTNLDYQKALNYYRDNHLKFDIIFLDPPYQLDCLNKIISLINNYHLLNNNGLIICELLNDNLDNYDNLDLYKEKHYGDKIIKVFKNKNI